MQGGGGQYSRMPKRGEGHFYIFTSWLIGTFDKVLFINSDFQ